MSEIIEYDFYVEGKPPSEIEGAEIVSVEKVLGNWHKLTLRFPKDQFDKIVKRIRKSGVRLARSANYPLV